MVAKHLVSFEHITKRFNLFLGTSRALIIGLGIFLVWAASFLMKSRWHATIVELVAMVSFLNIFLVQRGQNKDLKAIHLKLDELIASSNRANNSLIKAEEAPEEVLNQVHNIYKDLAKHAADENPNPRSSISSQLVEQVMESVHVESSSGEATIEYDLKINPSKPE